MLRVTVCMLLLSLLDLIGVGLIIPLVLLFSHGSNHWSAYLNHFTFFKTHQNDLLLWGVASFLLFFSLKTLLSRFGLRVNQDFIANLADRLSSAALTHYLKKPLLACYQTSRNEVMNRATELANVFSMELVNSLFVILSESVLILGALVFLFVLDPWASMILFGSSALLGCLGAYFYKGRLQRFSQAFSQAQVRRNTAIDNALLGLEEVKLYRAIPYCISRLQVASAETAKALSAYRVMMQFPRYLIELLAVFGFCLILSVLSLTHQYSDHFTMLVAFVAVIVRLLPSLSRVVTAAHNLDYGRYAFEQFREILKADDLPLSVTPPKPIQHAIEIRNLSFAYRPESPPILNHFNLNLTAGEFLAISAPSGCGKTTLTKLLSGLLPLNEPAICQVDGERVADLSAYAIALVPQHPFIAEGSLADNIAFGANVDHARVHEVLSWVGLAEKIQGWPEGLDTVIGDHGVELSGGQQQRLGIARALYRQPSLLILDEALSGSDPERVDQLFAVFRSLSHLKMLVVISHNAEIRRYCDREVVL